MKEENYEFSIKYAFLLLFFKKNVLLKHTSKTMHKLVIFNKNQFYERTISIGAVGKLTRVNTPSMIWLKPVEEEPAPIQS